MKPLPITYTDSQEVQAIRQTECSCPHFEDSSLQYAALFAEFEQVVHSVKKKRGVPGLMPSQKGRGQTRDRTMATQRVAPLKPSRPGEEQPSFEGINLRHKRWFTQVRRLVSYVNHVKHDRPDVSAQEHKFRLWRAILHAPGFGKNFATWWPCRATQNHGDPLLIPRHAPSWTMAMAILSAFRVEVQACEALLLQQRKARNEARYEADANQIFRDVRRPGPQPVQVLLSSHDVTVEQVISPYSVQCTEDIPTDSWHPWTSEAGSHRAVRIDGKQVQFADPHGLSPGQVLTRVGMLGAVADIHQAFADEWSRLWDKHKDLPDDYWSELHEFIDAQLPSGHMEYQPISLDSWKATIASKKARAAVGLDGISKSDILAMPDALHLGVLDLLHKAERTGRWPVQALNGAIHSLAKRATSEQVGDFRPVTILPLIYRCWGTIRAKQILAHLDKMAPPSMLGHMPKRSAPELWYHLQFMIEQCLYDGASGNGLVTDLVRAFNCLPREPIFHAAVRIGIPPEVVRAWASAVVGIRRFFYVRGQPSEGIRSCTGFPEGCALSVCAMGICNLIIHSFMAIRCPRVLLFSYVDNLELVSDCTTQALDGLQTLQTFTNFLGVPCDTQKTYAWALDTHGRQQFQEAELPVHMQQKDLGAHLQYCGRQTNGAVKQKCKDLQSLWPCLAQSPALCATNLRS